jgi:hypothetical protein
MNDFCSSVIQSDADYVAYVCTVFSNVRPDSVVVEGLNWKSKPTEPKYLFRFNFKSGVPTVGSEYEDIHRILKSTAIRKNPSTLCYRAEILGEAIYLITKKAKFLGITKVNGELQYLFKYEPRLSKLSSQYIEVHNEILEAAENAVSDCQETLEPLKAGEASAGFV